MAGQMEATIPTGVKVDAARTLECLTEALAQAKLINHASTFCQLKAAATEIDVDFCILGLLVTVFLSSHPLKDTTRL